MKRSQKNEPTVFGLFSITFVGFSSLTELLHTACLGIIGTKSNP